MADKRCAESSALSMGAGGTGLRSFASATEGISIASAGFQDAASRLRAGGRGGGVGQVDAG